MKILFCSTSTNLSTGYAKVSYKILNFLANFHDVWHLAFQHSNVDSVPRKLDERIHVIPDELFGIDTILTHVDMVKPDLVIIYNDVIVCSHYCNEFLKLKEKNFKFYIYIDLTYEFENYISEMNNSVVDKFICFNKTWENHVISMGVPNHKVTHINHPQPDPPSDLLVSESRELFKFKSNDFVILNLNRNSYRKCIDITIDGFIKFFKQNGCLENLKLFLGCKFTYKGSYDIYKTIDIFSKLHGLSPQEHTTLVTQSIVKFPHDSVDDSIIHHLYNACDVGLNTSCGEGWGLCNIEHQCYSRPQIITKLKTYSEFFHPDSTYFLEPRSRLIVHGDLDGVGGVMEVVGSEDVSQGMQFYYDNPEIRKLHGEVGKSVIDSMSNNFKNWHILK